MFLLIEQIILITISALAVFLGAWVYLQDRKKKSNKWFAIAAFCLLGWVNFAYFGSTAEEIKQSIFWFRLNLAIVPLCIFAYYLFAIDFSGREIKLWEKFQLAGLIALSFLSLFTNLMTEDVIRGEWKNEMIYGSMGMIYKFFTFLIVLIILKHLLSYYFLASKKEKRKVQYFIIGILLMAGGNTIFNVILPAFGIVKYSLFGDYSALFLLSFTAYAIIKKGLFDVKVILTDSLVIIMGLVWFILPLILDIALPARILMLVVFVFYCFIGYLLIRYTHREARQKEILEKQVQERTKELQERVGQLEKFHRLTVGRELKMVELKKEIEVLKEEREK